MRAKAESAFTTEKDSFEHYNFLLEQTPAKENKLKSFPEYFRSVKMHSYYFLVIRRVLNDSVSWFVFIDLQNNELSITSRVNTSKTELVLLLFKPQYNLFSRNCIKNIYVFYNN